MCLTVLGWGTVPRFPLVLVANRDEFHRRPSASMDWWPQAEVLAGRDLEAGGTWLGLQPHGRLGLLTNVREPGMTKDGRASRGHIIPLWLEPATTLQGLQTTLEQQDHNGYNLLALDLQQGVAMCLSNRHPHQALQQGWHGLSNAALNTPWPKVERLKLGLQAKLAQAPDGDIPSLMEELLTLLTDRHQPADDQLPRTGIPFDWERELGRIFISTPDGRYGTRCSTVILVERLEGEAWHLHALEQAWDARGHAGPRQLHRVEGRGRLSPGFAA